MRIQHKGCSGIARWWVAPVAREGRRVDFDIAVYAVNEAATIAACVRSVDQACAGRVGHISVLLNGSTDRSADILTSMRLSHAAMTIYRIPIADKANAVNQYFYALRRAADVYFGVDAYTTISQGALRAMAAALAGDKRALIASAVPVSGRSAASVAANTMKGGMVNGQFHGLRPDFIDRLVAAGYRLPLQIYRGDGLLGSMAAHDLDAVNTPWDHARVIGVAEATFALTPLSVFKWRDIRRQYQREIRQARGRMENAAIKSLIYAQGYGALPENANEMIRAWLKTNRPAPNGMRDQYFTRMALRQLEAAATIKAMKPEIVAVLEPGRA